VAKQEGLLELRKRPLLAHFDVLFCRIFGKKRWPYKKKRICIWISENWAVCPRHPL